MYHNLKDIRTNLTIAEAFVEKYSEYFPNCGYLDTGSPVSISFPKDEAIKVGEVFGRTGWTRSISYNRTSFDWSKTVDGVKITIDSIEDLDLNNTPVPEKSWPILLTQEETHLDPPPEFNGDF